MVLTINNLSLPLMYTPTGPVLSTEDNYLSPIAWVINSALGGDISHFADMLARGEDIFMEQLYAARPMPDEELSEPRARWHELTGSEPGKDVYVLGTGFTYHQVVLPRQTLQDIFQAILKKRAEFPEPPFPWLFRSDPYYFAPATGEEALLCELEKRARALKLPTQETVADVSDERKELLRDLKEAGFFSEEYSEEKRLWLEVWEYSTLLFYYKKYVNFMEQIRQAWSVVEPDLVLDVSISIRAPEDAHHSTTEGQVVYSQFAHT